MNLHIIKKIHCEKFKKSRSMFLPLVGSAGRCFLLEGFAADGGVVDDYDGHDDVNHGEW